MAQYLTALSPPENLGSVPASAWWFTTICDSISRGCYHHLLDPMGTAHTWYIDIHEDKVCIKVNKRAFKALTMLETLRRDNIPFRNTY